MSRGIISAFKICTVSTHAPHPHNFTLQKSSSLDFDLLQFEHDRLERQDRRQPEGRLAISEQSPLDSNVSALRIENMELRRKIDDLDTVKTEMQQKHLKEVREHFITPTKK